MSNGKWETTLDIRATAKRTVDGVTYGITVVSYASVVEAYEKLDTEVRKWESNRDV